jgi:3-oxoacyl-[acyl-carrier protein] reductase
MNQIDLKNRVAAITGGARGIGLAVAERFQRSGAKVALWDLDAAQAAAQRIEGAIGCTADVTDEKSVTAALAETERRLGPVDILVASAGIAGPNATVADYPVDAWRKEGNPNAAPYSAAKAGVIALTKSLGKELAQTGVRVNCVTPAAVKTAIFDQITEQHIQYMLSKIPMGRFGTVEEIAAMIAWLASEECSFSTGGVFDLSGGRATY